MLVRIKDVLLYGFWCAVCWGLAVYAYIAPASLDEPPEGRAGLLRRLLMWVYDLGGKWPVIVVLAVLGAVFCHSFYLAVMGKPDID